MRARQRAPLHLKQNVSKEPFASRRRDNSRRNTVTSMAVTLVIFKLIYAQDCFDKTNCVRLF